MIDFLGVLALPMLVNLLSMGVMSQPDFTVLQNASMAGVLEHVAGRGCTVAV